MATAIPQKIILRSTTNISLNERFGTLSTSTQNIRASKASERQALAKQQRFLRQMEKRPAPLFDNYVQYQTQGEEHRTSALLRLGVSRREPVHGRLPSGRRGGRRGSGRGTVTSYDDQYSQSVIKIISTGQPVAPAGRRGLRRRGRHRGRGVTPPSRQFAENDFELDDVTVGGSGRDRRKRRGNSSRGQRRGAQPWRGGAQPTRVQLDEQLDKYMGGSS